MAKKKEINSDIAFRNDARLKKANVEMAYTPEQIGDLVKCHEDVYHFAESYFEIVVLDADDSGNRRQIIQTRPYQKRIIDSVVDSRFTIVLSPRQIGKCLIPTTYINLRNKKTGKIEKVKIGDFYGRLSKIKIEIN